MVTGYLVWCPEFGETKENAELINASSRIEAAEEWARIYDWNSTEYRIAKGEITPKVIVEYQGGTNTFILSGETIPCYRARAPIIKLKEGMK